MCTGFLVPPRPIPTITLVSAAAAQGQNISALLPEKMKEAFASTPATYLSGHERFDFLHVQIVRGYSTAKTNHSEAAESWPLHREAMVNGHVELPTRVIPSSRTILGTVVFRLPLAPSAEERRHDHALHFPASKTAGSSVKPENLVALE